MPHRIFRTVPKEAIRHYEETSQTFVWDNRTSPALYNFQGIEFARTDDGYSPGNPGDFKENHRIAEDSMVKNIQYDIQMSFFKENDQGQHDEPVYGSALYVWPLSLDEYQAQRLVDFAPNLFELVAGDFHIKDITQVTWSQVMAELLKPEIVKIVGKPMQFLPTTVSDAEKMKGIHVHKRLQIWQKKQWFGWMVFADLKAKQENTVSVKFDKCVIYVKRLFNEYVA